ncbi:MAG: hypothetical protein J6S82_09265 [Bacteroidales bacterium]|nr:hypothetical protein [Bacteroidales bacterium]
MKKELMFIMLLFGVFALTNGQPTTYMEVIKKDYDQLYLYKGSHVVIRKAADQDCFLLDVPRFDSIMEWSEVCRWEDGTLHLMPNIYVSDTNRIELLSNKILRSVTIEPGATLLVAEEESLLFWSNCAITLLTNSAGDSGKIIFMNERERARLLKKSIRYKSADAKTCAWKYDMAYMQFQLRAPILLSNPRYENPYNTIFIWDLDYAIKVRFKHTASRWDFSTGLGLDMRSAMLSNQVDVVDRQLVFSEKTDHNRFNNSLFADYLNIPIEFSYKIIPSDDFSVVLGITPAVLIWEGYLRNDINENNRTKPSSEKIKVLNPWRLDIHAGISISYFELGIYGNPLPTYRAGVGGKPLREFGFYLKW